MLSNSNLTVISLLNVDQNFNFDSLEKMLMKFKWLFSCFKRLFYPPWIGAILKQFITYLLVWKCVFSFWCTCIWKFVVFCVLCIICDVENNVHLSGVTSPSIRSTIAIVFFSTCVCNKTRLYVFIVLSANNYTKEFNFEIELLCYKSINIIWSCYWKLKKLNCFCMQLP